MNTATRVPRERLTATDELVLETHVESGVSSRSESLAHLADNIPGTTVVIAHRILDLYRAGLVSHRVPHVTNFTNPSSNHGIDIHHYSASVVRTCMLTRCPSPFWPLTMAVTTTSWSFETKLRTHRSVLPEVAARSNLRAEASCTARMKRARNDLMVNGEEPMVGGMVGGKQESC